MNYQKIIPFIREETGVGLTTLAIVRIATTHNISTKRAFEKLQKAITNWVRTTRSGEECWKESDGDLNIGDLALYEQQFKKDMALKRFGIEEFEIIYCGETSEGSFPFDTHLVTKEE